MKLTLYTERYFDAAHQLKLYDGACAALHGHTWKICVWVQGDESQVEKNGILWDFNNLKKITNLLDHKYLNDLFDFNPTSEKLNREIYDRLKAEHPKLDFKVRLYESTVDRESYSELGDF